MIYIFIAVLIAIVFVILSRQKKFKQDDSIQLIQCCECGTYVSPNECSTKNGKCYCKDCSSMAS